MSTFDHTFKFSYSAKKICKHWNINQLNALEKSSPIVAPFHLAHLNLRGGHFLLIWAPVTQSDKLKIQNILVA